MKQLGKIWVFFDGKTKTQSKPLNVTQAQALILNLLKQKSTNIYMWTPGWNEWMEMTMFLDSEQDFFVLPPSFRNKIDDKTQLITQIKDDKTVLSKTNVFSDEATKAFNNAPNSFTEAMSEPLTKKIDYGYFFPDFRAEQIDININKINKNFSPKAPTEANIGNVTSVSSDRRDRVRFNFKLEILLVSKSGKTFRSESDNISMGGIKLIDKIPKEFLYMDFNLIIINKLEKDPKKSRIHFNTKCVGDISDPCRLVFMNPDKKNKELLEKLINTYIKQSKVA
jgi:hypothetical protein